VNSPDPEAGKMKLGKLVTFASVLAAVAVCAVSTGFAAKEKITPKNADVVGAGATFPAPLYQRWIKEFEKTNSGFSMFYDVVGSGEGTTRFLAEQVDFGASDAALSDAQLAQVQRGVQLIPATAGIIALAYNIPDVKGELRLSRQVYVDIFLGKIKYWNDERIQQLNPQLKLPQLNIVTITRSDSSGTTWAFTNHLSAISPTWRENGPGVGKKIDWPGNSMASRFNEGVAAKVKYSWGSIGYVEYGIAKRAGLSMAVVENKMGEYVKPTDTSGTATLANTSTQMPQNLRLFIPDPDGRDSYPIITYTWLLLYKSYADKGKAERVKQFVNWGLTQGQKYAAEYGYAPLPQPVVAAALNALTTIH
jgi:phosphate transport system substrate-binding protein